jgi:hypothetical protein
LNAIHRPDGQRQALSRACKGLSIAQKRKESKILTNP